MTNDDLDAQMAALYGEVEFYFPDPVDSLEDELAGLLGQRRHAGLSLEDWRQVRVKLIQDREATADSSFDLAAELAERSLAGRAAEWPY